MECKLRFSEKPVAQCVNNLFPPLQMGRAALAVEDFDVALYWFELVQTWAPSALQTEVKLCQGAGAVPAVPVRLSASAVLCCSRLAQASRAPWYDVHAQLDGHVVAAGSLGRLDN